MKNEHYYLIISLKVVVFSLIISTVTDHATLNLTNIACFHKYLNLLMILGKLKLFFFLRKWKLYRHLLLQEKMS